MPKNPRDLLYCNTRFIVVGWNQTHNISKVCSCRHHPEHPAQKLKKNQVNLYLQPLACVYIQLALEQHRFELWGSWRFFSINITWSSAGWIHGHGNEDKQGWVWDFSICGFGIHGDFFFFFLLWACFKNINMCLLKRQSSTLLCKPNPELLYYIRRRRKIRGELGQRVLFSKIGVMASV